MADSVYGAEKDKEEAGTKEELNLEILFTMQVSYMIDPGKLRCEYCIGGKNNTAYLKAIGCYRCVFVITWNL